MKVVIDTNFLVSAVLEGRVPRKVIQFIFAHADWEWIASPAIVLESEVLNVKKKPIKIAQNMIDFGRRTKIS
ncbi:MAG: PIN domain-containing protein [Goleter apudmare HA4340-LM2]|jgi:predicted nucleic acid-binding protein|nr:PIN domain-containing protein [Goleter apudmare HA4340-LM2]